MASKATKGGGILSSRIKSANVKFFPEGVLGYLGGPFFALIPNGIINAFLMQYWVNVLGLDVWAGAFVWLLPLISSIVIVIGNILVGKLMEGKPRKAGKARPLLVLSVPVIAIALVALFLTPYPAGATAAQPNILTLVIVAIGYNLFYAFAWPLYYTSHSAMVNLSTRNATQRSLLGTLSMAGQVGAAGVAGMAGGFLADLLGLLPLYDVDGVTIKDPFGWFGQFNNDMELARQSANGRWIIIDIVLIACLVVGVLLEFLFTRERITEEQFALSASGDAKADAANAPKKVKMGDQVKVSIHDKYWWFIILFFFLYQLGGMLKNNGQIWYSQAWTYASSLSSLIGTLGAIPTALGMVVVWPLANKFGKAVTIKWGAALAVLFGFVGWMPQFMGLNPGADEALISTFSILGFCLKALGTVPAMYVSLALMSDVLDHQEAVYGIRTDGFTMAVYGSIMIAMTGISNALILAIRTPFFDANGAALDPAGYRFAMTMIFFGGEMVCYLIIFLLLMFMNVEKFIDLDHAAIDEAQRKEAEAKGIAYVPAAERLKAEQAQAEIDSRNADIEELRAKCEKSGQNFEEALAAYEASEAEKAAKAQAKKEANEAKAAEKKAAKEKAEADRRAALTAEQRAAEDQKKAEKAAAAAAEAERLAAIHAEMVAKGHALLK